LLRVVLGAKLVTQDEVGLPTSGALKAQVRYRDLFPLLYRSPAPLRFVQPRNELVDPTLHRQAADFDLLGTVKSGTLPIDLSDSEHAPFYST
jgi:hypothetical protein